MITFQQFLENKELYLSLLNPQDIKRREELYKLVQLAYEKNDHKTAEKLDAELEELEEKLEAQLEDMDDGSQEDDKGEEEKDIDLDWSIQDEFARIYDQYIKGHLDLDDDQHVQVEPEEAKKNGWEIKQAIDHQGKKIDRFYRIIPITKEKALANMLKGAIWESPYLSQHQPNKELIDSLTDQQIIDIARDSWEWKKNLRDRIK